MAYRSALSFYEETPLVEKRSEKGVGVWVRAIVTMGRSLLNCHLILLMLSFLRFFSWRKALIAIQALPSYLLDSFHGLGRQSPLLVLRGVHSLREPPILAFDTTRIELRSLK